MTETVTSGLMRGRWRRSDGPLEGDTRPKWGETARPRTPCTPPRLRPTLPVRRKGEWRACPWSPPLGIAAGSLARGNRRAAELNVDRPAYPAAEDGRGGGRQQ